MWPATWRQNHWAKSLHLLCEARRCGGLDHPGIFNTRILDYRLHHKNGRCSRDRTHAPCAAAQCFLRFLRAGRFRWPAWAPEVRRRTTTSTATAMCASRASAWRRRRAGRRPASATAASWAATVPRTTSTAWPAGCGDAGSGQVRPPPATTATRAGPTSRAVGREETLLWDGLLAHRVLQPSPTSRGRFCEALYRPPSPP